MLTKFNLVRTYLDACDWIPTWISIRKEIFKKLGGRKRQWIFISQETTKSQG